MMRQLRVLLVVLACLPVHVRPADLGSELPVKRVVLFKNGVGYFEHLGSVRANQAVTISFTSGQLNDVLKSLTVLDLNGGTIAGVAYSSAAPLDKQVNDLRLPIDSEAKLTDILGALRGTRVEVKNGAAVVTGRVLSVETKTRSNGLSTNDVTVLTVISDGGDLRTIEISTTSTVKLLEPGLATKIDRFLDIASSAREADVRRMTISTAGSGDRSLFVSYISEVPVWKSTYRIVLDTKAGRSPLLQGWAIIDNVVGEDWRDVQLSLVAGAPQSFIQELSQPYYVQRPRVALPESVSTAPQTYQSTLIPGNAELRGSVLDPTGAGIESASVKAYDSRGTLMAQTQSGVKGAYHFDSLPSGPMRLQVEAPGFQIGSVNNLVASAGEQLRQDVTLNVGNSAETVFVENSNTAGSGRTSGNGSRLGSGRALSAAPKGMPESGSAGGSVRLDEARVQSMPGARSQALGDLFEYKLKEPVTILKNRSAMVPIAQASIEAEKVSVWNERAKLPCPQRALWITNSTGLTLDGGSVSILEENTFAGEGIFEQIRPGEKRLLSYATDLAVTASSRTGNDRQRVSHVRIAGGTMIQESEIREKATYTFRNEDTAKRTILVEHPVRAGYSLRGLVRPVETTADFMRFRLALEAKQTASLEVEEFRPTKSSFTVSALSNEQVAEFAAEGLIDAATRKALLEILEQKSAVAVLEEQKSASEQETEKIFDDQQRLRENMKALKGTAEEKALVQRYTRQLNDQENRLEELKKAVDRLDAQIEAANERISQSTGKLTMDLTL